MTQPPPWAYVLNDRVTKGLAPGIVALAAYPDRVEWWTAGFQDIRQGIPMARDTLFRIASVSKIATAACALMLVDDGILSLDEPLDQWLPELAGKPAITSLYGPPNETAGRCCPGRRSRK